MTDHIIALTIYAGFAIGLYRESQKAHWNEAQQNFVHKTYRTTQCQMFKKLCGEYGAAVKKDYSACKYFEQKIR